NGKSCHAHSYSDPMAAAQAIYFDTSNQPNSQQTITTLKGQMRVNYNNAYAYSNPKAAGGLIHLAFGPWLDGSHSMLTTTNLNALQAFGLIYMLLSHGENTVNLDEQFLPDSGGQSRTNFKIVMPSVCHGDSGSSAALCNSVFANAFTAYHH